MKFSKGFTLIELLVVVLIIGILAAIAIPMYEKSVEHSRMAEAVAVVKALAEANKRYYLATGAYTTNISLLDVTIQGTPVASNLVDTKYFRYLLTPGNPTIANAYRLPYPEKYRIYALPTTSNFSCYFPAGSSGNAIETALCNELQANGTI